MVILSVRPRALIKKEGYAGVSNENPFYFNDLSYTKVFTYLADVDDKHIDGALKLAVETMSQIILLGDKKDGENIFSIEETYHLFDVDFFTLELDDKNRLSHRDDVRNLAAVIKKLIKQLIDTQKEKGNEKSAHEIFERYIGNYENKRSVLPDSRSMWRLRLFVLSLYPKAFKNELKKSFFRLFEIMETKKSYSGIISGAEYEKALKESFFVLGESDKREYVEKVIESFEKKDKENDDENWHLQYGSDLFSTIFDQLTEVEKEKAEKAGFKINPNHKPEPSIKMNNFAEVISQAPLTYEDFQKMEISEISKKIRGEWSPKNLYKKYRGSTSFHRPINAEGLGEFLKKNVAEKLQEYVDISDKFFDKGSLDPHYTYSFLRGIQEAIKNNQEQTKEIKWKKFFAFCVSISKEKEFERRKEEDKFDAWLAGWDDVHSSITDVLQILLDSNSKIDFPKYRNDLFSILKYLLKYPDPKQEEEKIKNAQSTMSDADGSMAVSDPFTMAINSVRGRAFQAFVLFVYKDGKDLSSDVKKLYEEVLNNENTRAIMFLFGHYLPSFYFRGQGWIKKMLPKIFPDELAKKYLYLAAWEGYLATNIYKEIFSDPVFQNLYERGIALTDTEYPQQKHFKDPDEGLAIHLALAFMHFEGNGFDKDLNFKHPLLKTFWEKDSPKQHTAFVSFIGRSFISGSNVGMDKLIKEDPSIKENLKKLWDYLLKNCNDAKVFEEMGFWMSLEKNIFEAKWLAERVKKTLEKSKGALDWELGLTEVIKQLAEKSPEDSLEIARWYLLEGVAKEKSKKHFPVDIGKWFDAFQVLYKNSTTKKETIDLIDDLMKTGGSQFWELKKIII